MKNARILFLATMFASSAALAQTSAVESSIERAIAIGTKVLFAIAAFMVLYGIVGGGMAIANSDMDGKKKAGAAMAGGLLVAMASKVVGMLFEIGR
jgi:hypothetical protein